MGRAVRPFANSKKPLIDLFRTVSVGTEQLLHKALNGLRCSSCIASAKDRLGIVLRGKLHHRKRARYHASGSDSGCLAGFCTEKWRITDERRGSPLTTNQGNNLRPIIFLSRNGSCASRMFYPAFVLELYVGVSPVWNFWDPEEKQEKLSKKEVV